MMNLNDVQIACAMKVLDPGPHVRAGHAPALTVPCGATGLLALTAMCLPTRRRLFDR
jgi:hypothetical protein